MCCGNRWTAAMGIVSTALLWPVLSYHRNRLFLQALLFWPSVQHHQIHQLNNLWTRSTYKMQNLKMLNWIRSVKSAKPVERISHLLSFQRIAGQIHYYPNPCKYIIRISRICRTHWGSTTRCPSKRRSINKLRLKQINFSAIPLLDRRRGRNSWFLDMLHEAMHKLNITRWLCTRDRCG